KPGTGIDLPEADTYHRHNPVIRTKADRDTEREAPEMNMARRWSARGVLAAVICLGSVAATTGAASAAAALDVGDPAILLAGGAFVAASLATCTGTMLPGPVPLPAPPACKRTEAYKVIWISTGP